MGYNASIFLIMPKIVWDVDALAFIAAQNANTGLQMGIVQKIAVNNLYKRFKNVIPTPNGSDLWTKVVASGSRIWILCPVNDTTASAAAYNIEFVSKTVLGTFNGFASGDYTPNGVTGGTLPKYFNAGNSPNAYPLNDILDLFYTRAVATGTAFGFGATDAAAANRLALSLRATAGIELGYQVNDNTPTNFSSTLANNKGLIGVQRAASGTKTAWLNGVSINSTAVASTGRTANNVYFHALNNNGTASNSYDKQLCLYGHGLPALTANEHSDLSWIINLYQTEVITGGRQV